MQGEYQVSFRFTDYQPRKTEATYREGTGAQYRTV